MEIKVEWYFWLCECTSKIFCSISCTEALRIAARMVMAERKDTGPIRPCHMREAYRRLKLEGKIPKRSVPRLFRWYNLKITCGNQSMTDFSPCQGILQILKWQNLSRMLRVLLKHVPNVAWSVTIVLLPSAPLWIYTWRIVGIWNEKSESLWNFWWIKSWYFLNPVALFCCSWIGKWD